MSALAPRNRLRQYFDIRAVGSALFGLFVAQTVQYATGSEVDGNWAGLGGTLAAVGVLLAWERRKRAKGLQPCTHRRPSAGPMPTGFIRVERVLSDGEYEELKARYLAEVRKDPTPRWHG